MSFEDFIKEHYPEMEVIYKRSLRSWDDLKPGTIVLTLRYGFGGPDGVFRKVKEVVEDNFGERITLISLDKELNKSESLLYKNKIEDRDEYWWQEVVLVDHDYISSLSFGDHCKHINNILANKIVS